MAENNTEVTKVAINDIGTEEDFIKAVDSTIKNFDDGDLVEGTVVKIDHDEVLLDIGYKTEGVIPSRELSIKKDVDPDEVVEVGDTIEALVVTKEDKGNYKYPEGFDPNTNEWIAGYEKQREEWESQYAAAHELWEEHKAFVAKELENAAASAAEDGQAPKEEKVEETSNYSSDNSSTGTLADSDQLAALRDQLLGK